MVAIRTQEYLLIAFVVQMLYRFAVKQGTKRVSRTQGRFSVNDNVFVEPLNFVPPRMPIGVHANL